MNASRRNALVMSMTVGLGIGCSGGGGHVLPVTSQPISQSVGPDGAEISISALGDPVLAGTTLLIPKGALDHAVVITVSRGDEQATGTKTGVGPSLRFLPDGLTFAIPATLTLPYDSAKKPPGTVLAVAVNAKGVKTEITGNALTIDAAAKTVAIDIGHFTDYEVVAEPAGGRDGGTDGGGTDGGARDGGTDGGHGFDGGSDGGIDGGRFDGGIDGGIFDGGIHD